MPIDVGLRYEFWVDDCTHPYFLQLFTAYSSNSGAGWSACRWCAPSLPTVEMKGVSVDFRALVYSRDEWTTWRWHYPGFAYNTSTAVELNGTKLHGSRRFRYVLPRCLSPTSWFCVAQLTPATYYYCCCKLLCATHMHVSFDRVGLLVAWSFGLAGFEYCHFVIWRTAAYHACAISPLLLQSLPQTAVSGGKRSGRCHIFCFFEIKRGLYSYSVLHSFFVPCFPLRVGGQGVGWTASQLPMQSAQCRGGRSPIGRRRLRRRGAALFLRGGFVLFCFWVQTWVFCIGSLHVAWPIIYEYRDDKQIGSCTFRVLRTDELSQGSSIWFSLWKRRKYTMLYQVRSAVSLRDRHGF